MIADEKNAFSKWLEKARDNQRYTYYIGVSLADDTSIWEVKKLVWTHALKGDVYLFQRKLDRVTYEYIAIKVDKPLLRMIPLDYSTREYQTSAFKLLDRRFKANAAGETEWRHNRKKKKLTERLEKRSQSQPAEASSQLMPQVTLLEKSEPEPKP